MTMKLQSGLAILLCLSPLGISFKPIGREISLYSPSVYEDIESALASGTPIPIDLVPEDLAEELPGISSSTVENLYSSIKHHCKERAKGGDPPHWNWTAVKGIGEVRAELLKRFFLPPICISGEFQPLSSEYSHPGAEALLRDQVVRQVPHHVPATRPK